ncbi:alpha/beta fold hydrolase [Nocardia sp. NPDC004278]
MSKLHDRVTPKWFTAALATTATDHEVHCDGIRIVYRSWGPPTTHGVVLVHGGAANTQWWDHIAPFLATDRRVIALDLSGHGDSGWRREYDLDCWSRDVQAVVRDTGLHQPVLIGHSLGGLVCLHVEQTTELPLAVVIIDSLVRGPENGRVKQSARPLRVYPTLQEAVQRWRPLAADSGTIPDFIVRHVARESLRAVPGGWTWKFDPAVFAFRRQRLDELAPARSRIALIRAAHGPVSPEDQYAAVAALGPGTLDIVVPEVGHNVPLEEPIATVALLRALLAVLSPNHQFADQAG